MSEPPEQPPQREVKQRSELEIRWRQATNAPQPVVRAVAANLVVATVGGIILLLLDWLADHGELPEVLGGPGPTVVYVIAVIVSGTVFTYLWVELPTGVPGEKRRSPWAGMLGLFAAIPITYLALVVVFQVLRPLLP
ncbi:MAG: hypothetical protein AB1Z66_13505 [Candidatus Limnocylindrales bacterium]